VSVYLCVQILSDHLSGVSLVVVVELCSVALYSLLLEIFFMVCIVGIHLHKGVVILVYIVKVGDRADVTLHHFLVP